MINDVSENFQNKEHAFCGDFLVLKPLEQMHQSESGATSEFFSMLIIRQLENYPISVFFNEKTSHCFFHLMKMYCYKVI
jgi:hypothetical protein